MGFFFVIVISIVNLLGTLKDYEFMILLLVFFVVMYLAMQVHYTACVLLKACVKINFHIMFFSFSLVHFLSNFIEWTFMCRVALCSLGQGKRIATSDNWGDRLLHYTMKAIQNTRYTRNAPTCLHGW